MSSVVLSVVFLCGACIVTVLSQLQPLSPPGKSTIEASIRVLQATSVGRASTVSIRHASKAVVNHKRFATGTFIDAVLAGLRSPAGLVVTIDDDGSSKRTQRPLDESAPRFNNVFFVDGYEAFRSIYERLHHTQYDFTGFFTVVLTRSTRYQYDIISRILQDCWQLHITNVIVLVAMQSRTPTVLYTYFPFTPYHCEQVRPVILNYYRIADDRFLYERSDFFPPKAHNMHGCAVHMAIFQFVPYIWVRSTKAGGRPLLDGVEGAVMQCLAKRLNFTAIVRTLDGDRRGGSSGSGGVLYANGTGTGVLGMLLRNEVNVSVGALEFRNDRKALLSPSSLYLQDSIVLAVSMGRKYTAKEKLFMPFKREVWIRMGVLLGGAGVVIAILRRRADALAFVAGPRNRSPFTNMVAILLGASLMPTMPVRNFARYVLMVWTLGSLVLRTAYLGALFHFMQTPMEEAPIDRLDDMLAANYALRMTPDWFVMFDEISKAKPHLRPTAFVNNTLEFEELSHRPTYRDAYITLAMVAGFYNHLHIDRTVHVASEPVYTVSICMYYRKHSCISESFNWQLGKFVANGQLNMWQKQFVDWDAIRLATKLARGNHIRRPLRIEELMGTFQICAAWLMVSTFVFVLEMMTLRCALLGRLFD